MRRLDANGNQKLTSPRVFTQAQWPPSTPYVGEVVQLNDTNNSASWMLEYRPDLNSTKPWRFYNGNTAANSTLVIDNPGTNAGSFILGVGGDWYLYQHALSTSVSGASNTITVAFGTTASGTDISSVTSAAAQPCIATTTTTYTATKGQTIYVTHGSSNQSNQACMHVVYFRPLNLANA